MKTFLNKTDSLYRSSHVLHPSSPQSPASTYLKKELSQIIKDELKTYQLRIKLQAELHDYKQKEANKQLSKMLFEEKMHAYKERQMSSRKKKYEEFLQKQRLRQQRLKQFMKQKQQQHYEKFAQINNTIENVRERNKLITDEDSSFRLTKLGLITSQDKRQQRQPSKKTQRSSRSSSHRQIIRKKNLEKEAHLVTNYLKKIQKSESRVLLKQLDNEKRAQTSKKSRVKCLVEQRNKHQVELMIKAQKQYKERMQHFQINNLRLKHQKSSTLLTRSMLSDSNFKNVMKRRQLLKNEQRRDSLTRNNFNGLLNGKQNILKGYKSSLDLTNDERSRRYNLSKMEREAYEANLDHKMKLIYEKLQKIKNIKYGQKLDQRSLGILLSMLDKSDPEYAAIVDFLSNERKAFLEGWVRRQQERSKFDKLKKANKTLAKTNT